MSAGLQGEPVANHTAQGRPRPPYIAEEGAVYGAEPSSSERWQRVTLAPGVELHLRHPVDAEHRAAVNELLARADGLFRSDI